MTPRRSSAARCWIAAVVALCGCEGPIYFGDAECDLDRVEDVRLSELEKPLVEMEVPPAAYLDTVVGVHPLLVFRAPSDDSTAVPDDAIEVEIVFTPFEDEGSLDIHGPRTYDGRQRCYFEKLHAFNELSLRTPDGVAVAGPSATGVVISAVDEEFTEFAADVVLAPELVEALGLVDVPATLRLSATLGWEDPQAPELPVSIRGSLSDRTGGATRRVLELRTPP